MEAELTKAKNLTCYQHPIGEYIGLYAGETLKKIGKLMDELTQQIYKVVKNSNEPLATDEIVDAVKQPRHLVIHRLRNLAMEGKIHGKQTKERGAWIWWFSG
jgi:hypothetical protein